MTPENGLKRRRMMDARNRLSRHRTMRSAALLLMISGFVVVCGPARADELPVFRQGLWKYQRTIAGGKTIDVTKCANPTEDMKKQNEKLGKGGCRFSPLTKSGNTYTFTADCSIKIPSGGEIKGRTTTVITVESESAYTVEVHGTAGGQETKERLVARRVGDCP
jgi:uncharacterized protein affecting Mg2+/Co2+ transport